jgi:membrane protein
MDQVKLPSRRRRADAARSWWARSIGGHGLRRIRELDLDTHALAFCAQQVLCTAPLVVAISAVAQRFTGRSVGYAMSRFFGLYGDSAAAVDRLFRRTSPTSISMFALVFAMVTAVLFTTGVGAVQQRAFELIWTLPRIVSVRSYLRQLSWAVMLGVYSVLMLLLGHLGRVLQAHLHWPGLVAVGIVQGAVTFLFYWWTQRWLLGGRVTWRALLPGALSVAIATTIMFRLTRVIVPAEISWQVHAYGLIGAVFVLSVWLSILCGLVFGGVLLGALITERRLAASGADPGETDASPLTARGMASAADDELGDQLLADRS